MRLCHICDWAIRYPYSVKNRGSHTYANTHATDTARSGLAGALLLFTAAAIVAVAVGAQFVAVLAGYYVLTWAYSLHLKRVPLLDVIMLAGLYTLRIIAGAAAMNIPLSF